jgi:indolepyruvate ferredoxin oxidoreductase alpha subunit
VCRAIGVANVVEVDAFDVKAVDQAIAAGTAQDGLAVIVAKGDCIFVSRSPQPPYSVDTDTCVACGKCIQAGCPGNVLSEVVHVKTGKHKSRIDHILCIGCDVCRQICPTGAIRKPAA